MKQATMLFVLSTTQRWFIYLIPLFVCFLVVTLTNSSMMMEPLDWMFLCILVYSVYLYTVLVVLTLDKVFVMNTVFMSVNKQTADPWHLWGLVTSSSVTSPDSSSYSWQVRRPVGPVFHIISGGDDSCVLCVAMVTQLSPSSSSSTSSASLLQPFQIFDFF